MEQYIPKSALEAEIEKRKAINEKSYMQAFLNSNDNRDSFGYKVQEDIDILSLLDTIGVKEVDLEKELDSWRHSHFHGRRDKEASGEYLERVSQLDLAKHFYELGVAACNKAQKGE